VTDFTIPGRKPERGKVRDIYKPPDHAPDGDLLAFVVSDRVSAYDNVVGEIPGIGILRNKFTNFWKRRLAPIVTSDLVSDDLAFFNNCLLCSVPGFEYANRVSVVKHLQMIPVEAIIRNAMTGSLKKLYDENDCQAGYYLGHYLPAKLVEAQQLPMPIFTPTTKAPVGEKDVPLSCRETIEVIRQWLKSVPILREADYTPEMVAQMVCSTSHAIFGVMNAHANRHGILLADLKLEFGLPPTLKQGFYLGDEISPDSFRAYQFATYRPGEKQESLDKQPIRNFIAEHPGKPIPQEVINQTYKGYKNIYEMLCTN
jgi:phosphoribosylaminoimidazole-succinocarboxamide synthase